MALEAQNLYTIYVEGGTCSAKVNVGLKYVEDPSPRVTQTAVINACGSYD